MSDEPDNRGDEVSESSRRQAPKPESSGLENLVRAAAASPMARAETSVLGAIGGVWGIVASALPILLFIIVFTVTNELGITLIASVGVAVIVMVVSLLMRKPVSQALGGLIGVLVCALVSRLTGRSEDFFAIGLITNAAYALGLAITVFLRYPLVGIIMGAMRLGQGEKGPFFAWRDNPALLRRYSVVTWLWTALFVIRLLVQVPLYFAGMTTMLGTAKIVMGLPLFAILLWMSWLILRKPAAD